MAYKKDPGELGVLWEKSGSNGPYFTGSIEISGTKQSIIVFKNDHKRSDKAPDWRILKSQPREQKESLVDPRTDDNVPF